MLFAAAGARAATIPFSGQLGVIPIDTGGIDAGTALGTTFTGFSDDVTANGEITETVTTTCSRRKTIRAPAVTIDGPARRGV